jgi:hypothetical protein
MVFWLKRGADMKIKIISASIVVLAGIFGYMWYMNLGLFRGDSVAGLPNGHVKVLETRQSHFDLLFSKYGGVSFNHYGERINVYIAYYERDNRVLHEVVAGIAAAGANRFGGSMLWGLTAGQNRPRELSALVSMNGALGRNYFDFSQFDFEPMVISGPDITNGPIERDKRYILQVWQTGASLRAGAYAFDPEILRESENTAILYMVFE